MKSLVSRLCLLAGAAALAASTAGAAQPAYAATMPPQTFSRYVETLNLQTMGCNQGKSSDAQGQHHQLVILDFGEPASSGGTLGTIDFTLGFISLSQIEAATERYMTGYVSCLKSGSKSYMTVAMGTSNFGGFVNATHGQAWGNAVGTLQSWITSKTFGAHLWAEGAFDAEPSWNSFSATTAWANAFNTTKKFYYDYGSADGCPLFSAGSCNNGWTTGDVYQISWGIAAANAVPEIYTESGSQADQWEQASLWGVAHSSQGKIQFSIALSQHQACVDVGDPCTGVDNTVQQSWAQLTAAIDAHSSTSYTIPYASEVSYQQT